MSMQVDGSSKKRGFNEVEAPSHSAEGVIADGRPLAKKIAQIQHLDIQFCSAFTDFLTDTRRDCVYTTTVIDPLTDQQQLALCMQEAQPSVASIQDIFFSTLNSFFKRADIPSPPADSLQYSVSEIAACRFQMLKSAISQESSRRNRIQLRELCGPLVDAIVMLGLVCKIGVPPQVREELLTRATLDIEAMWSSLDRQMRLSGHKELGEEDLPGILKEWSL